MTATSPMTTICLIAFQGSRNILTSQRPLQSWGLSCGGGWSLLDSKWIVGRFTGSETCAIGELEACGLWYFPPWQCKIVCTPLLVQ